MLQLYPSTSRPSEKIPRVAAAPPSKRPVEIISGRDRRLQGEGEETGPRLQRDRSGVSEMEPLPATQDALRFQLRSAKAWNYATLPPPSCAPALLNARLRTTVDPRVPRRRCVVIVATATAADTAAASFVVVVIIVTVFICVFGLLVSSSRNAEVPYAAGRFHTRNVR